MQKKQFPNLVGVDFRFSDYRKLEIPNNSIVYFDPPYEGTTGYNSTFDHSDFWGYVRMCHELGHTVFVSEYRAPKDFICVWEKNVNNSLTQDTGQKQGIEKLFTI